MDVNGTRYHLLLGEQDWLSLAQSDPEEGLYWDLERQVLSLKPRIFKFTASKSDWIPQIADRRGSGRDRFGNSYWISRDEMQIRFQPAHLSQSQHFWSSLDPPEGSEARPKVGDFQPTTASSPVALQLRGLAVTERHYLVVGVLDPAGILIFDLHAGGPPVQMLWPQGFSPFDLAPLAGGGLVILERGNAALGEAPRLWVLDRYLRVIAQPASPPFSEEPPAADFQPQEAGESDPASQYFPPTIFLSDAIELPQRHFIGVAGLTDGTLLLLESDPQEQNSRIWRYNLKTRVGDSQNLQTVLGESAEAANLPEEAWLWGADLAFVPDSATTETRVSGTLYIAEEQGNQSYAFRLTAEAEVWKLDLLARYLPMRRFDGVGLVAGTERAHYHNESDRWVPLVAQPRPRYHLKAHFTTDPFDGKTPGCVWHRLFLDAAIPPGTQVLLESRAADEKGILADLPWQAEPDVYLRGDGPEIPYARAFSAEEAARPGTGTWETLFQHCRGRYLQLRVTLTGNGRNTPRLRSLRVYYPRFSYLEAYLPAVYGQDENTASFLERFLANLEGIYTTIEDRIRHVQTQLDIDSAREEYLDWLASWLGVSLEAGWDVPRQRLFLRHAPTLFKQRGTIAGLIRSITLMMHPCPDESMFSASLTSDVFSLSRHQSVRIVEQFLTRQVPGIVYGEALPGQTPDRFLPETKWSPQQDAGPLHTRYREFLRARYASDGDELAGIAALKHAWQGPPYHTFGDILFSPLPPKQPQAAADWNQFRETRLGFTYAVVQAKDVSIYQDFLARRYRHIAALNTAYEWTEAQAKESFKDLALPDQLPASGPRLMDWIQFVSMVLPVQRTAHCFTILVPTDTRGTQGELETRLALVERIANLEKPSHTYFTVKPYWALFRVGEARLGLDSLLDEGSRFIELLLGRTHLAHGFLVPERPAMPDRLVTGRDVV